MVVHASDAGLAYRAVLAAGRLGQATGAAVCVRVVEDVVVRIRLDLGAVVRGIDDGVRAGARGEVGEDVGPRQHERDEQLVVDGEPGVGLEEEEAGGAGEEAKEEDLRLSAQAGGDCGWLRTTTRGCFS